MVIVIDPQIAGVSGDMLLCSLVDLGANKEKIISGVKKSKKFLPFSTIKKIDFQKIQKHGIQSTQLILELDEDIHERKGSEIKQAILDSVETLKDAHHSPRLRCRGTLEPTDTARGNDPLRSLVCASVPCRTIYGCSCGTRQNLHPGRL